VSAPEGIVLAACPADIIELVAFSGRAADLATLAGERGLTLPGSGGIVARAGRCALQVRPGRWLVLSPPAAPGESAAQWLKVGDGCAAIVDLSSALAAFLLKGPLVGEMLARACRLDLAAGAFPAGTAAATIMVQVPAILARLTPGMLLLTPATTARHLREWLVASSRPFGLELGPDTTVSELCGDRAT